MTVNIFVFAARNHTLPIINSPTLSAAPDMDHDLPVMVQMYLPVTVNMVLCVG